MVIIVGAGYFMASKNVLKEAGKDVMSLLLNKVTLPLLIVSVFPKIIFNSENINNSIYVVIAVFIVYGINYSYSKIWSNKLNNLEKPVFINGALHSNTSFLPFPLLYAVYGDVGLFYASLYYMVDTSMMMTIGIKRFRLDTKEKTKPTPLTIAIIVSLCIMVLVNIFNIDITHNVVYQAVADIGNMAIPIALLFVGMIIYESNIKEVMLNKLAIKLVVLKTTILPLIAIGILFLIKPNIDGLIIIIIMTQMMMPPLLAIIPLAYEYKKDVKLATSMVVFGHIYAFVNITILFSLLVFLFK